MADTEYTLTGFGDFLERRRIVFVEPLPSTRICGVCSVVPSRSVLLPCGHVLCPLRRDQIGEENAMCPLDRMVFVEADVISVTFKQSQLGQLRVFCVAGGRKCGFSGKLCELKDHLVVCGGDKVKCARCHSYGVRSQAIEYYSRCFAKTPTWPEVSSAASAFAVLMLQVMKDLGRVREGMSVERVGQDTIVNVARISAECGVNPQRSFIVGEAGRSEFNASLLAAEKTTAAAGPFRAVSKPGTFITTCEFRDVYARYIALKGNKEEHFIFTDTCILAGYTFMLEGKFQKQGGEVVVSFGLFLRNGAWDDYVEWPFSQKVTMIISHPRDESKDMRLRVKMEDPRAIKKPVPGNCNWGPCTAKKNWQDLKLKGFVHNKALYVNIEFE